MKDKTFFAFALILKCMAIYCIMKILYCNLSLEMCDQKQHLHYYKFAISYKLQFCNFIKYFISNCLVIRKKSALLIINYNKYSSKTHNMKHRNI